MKIMILGGYGVFGGRLAELLSDIPEIDLLICGRNLDRAEAFCSRYNGQARVHPLALDRADIVAALRARQPDVVVDASGPFQDYGDDRYRVISACIDAGINYLDFADAADFVFGVSEFDAKAQQRRQVYSYFPASAVSRSRVVVLVSLSAQDQRSRGGFAGNAEVAYPIQITL